MRSGKFTPVHRIRVVDTQKADSPTGGKFLWAQQDLTVRAVGQGEVPWSGVSAVSLVVTVRSADEAGRLIVKPAGGNVSEVAMMSFDREDTVTSVMVASVGFGSPLQVQSPNASKIHVTVDIIGWWSDNAATGAGYVPSRNPYEIVNTTKDMTGRKAAQLSDSEKLSVQCRSQGDVSANATAVLVNATVSNPSQDTTLLLGPSDNNLFERDEWCRVSRGKTRSVLGPVSLTHGGIISTAIIGGPCDVRLDVLGYFAPKRGLALSLITPRRIFDSTQGIAHTHTAAEGDLPAAARREPLEGSEVIDLPVRQVQNVATNAKVALTSLTVSEGNTDTYMTAFESGRWRPLTPSIHAHAGDLVTNQAFVRLDEFGWAAIHNNAGDQHLAVDLMGYFS